MCLRRIALLLLLAGVASSAARAEEVRIIGDSIGEGLHLASSVPSPANRYNVAIYTPYILKQISEMPRGANVVMSLGTNDAVAGLDEQQPRILQIAAAAREQGIKLTWLGPPCVRTAWEVHSEKLDKVIAAALADTSVAYVSAQTPEFCAPGLHAGDGVHFTMAGYRLLWQKAASVAGIPILEAAASDHKAAVASSHKKVLVCHKKSSSGKKSCHYKLVTPLASPAASAPG
jgi:hypothetical protein